MPGREAVASGGEMAVRQFSAELRELRVSAGSPSFRSLERLAEPRGSLPRSTAAEAVAGRRLPSLPSTMAFVSACVAYASENSISLALETQDFGRWQQRWIEAKRAVDKLRSDVTAGGSGDVEPAEQPGGRFRDQDDPPLASNRVPSLSFAPQSPPWGRSRLPDRSRSWAVVMGTAQYESAELPQLLAVQDNVSGMADALTTPGLGGFDKNRCTVLLDASDLTSVGRALADVTRSVHDVLLFYYSGHSLLDVGDGDLYLTLTGSEYTSLYFTAVSFTRLAKELANARAEHTVIILDCDYAGRALRTGAVGDNTYVLCATGPTRRALAVPGERFTAFTGDLLHALRGGSASRELDEVLPLDWIYAHVARQAEDKERPRPQRLSTGDTGQLALTRVVPPEPTDT
ncbi:caspase family protein [Streptomyces sp. SP2-10]|uniref:caspase family protein n=1 Tax=Streptomyces sp. SP2-10 TaxID=2873385 RepID=UPI0027E1C054|nr:caspase family protein [Streptomyces sp. SP2-10]